MAPNAPIGAAFMMMAMTPNIAWPASSTKARNRATRSPAAISEKPNNTENSSTCNMSPLAKAPTTLSGMRPSRKSSAPRGCATSPENPATAAASALPGKPVPGWSVAPTSKPAASASVETISK